MSNLRYPVPKAIFFDFDGVVLDSANIKTEAFGLLFKAWPEHRDAILQHHLQHMGISRYRKFEWIYKNLIGREISPEESEQLGKDFSEICFDQILQAPFIPGVQRLLGWCVGRCYSFVASGTPEDELTRIIADRGLTHLFQEIGGTPRSKGQIVRTLLDTYSLKPGQCWFIGDARTDQEVANELGLHFIAVNSAGIEEYWLQQSKVWLVDSLDEVTQLLERDGNPAL